MNNKFKKLRNIKLINKIIILKCVYLVLFVNEYFLNPSKNKLSKDELNILCHMLLNLKYERHNLFGFLKVPTVKTNDETLDKLLKEKGSICRYGDGEFNIMKGNSILFQEYSLELSKRLCEIINNNDDKILVGIPRIFGELNYFKDGCSHTAADFWREYLIKNRDIVYNFLNFDKIYYNSFITRPYMDYKEAKDLGEYFLKLKQLWENRDIVFVEGKKSRLGVGNDLFDNAKSIQRILCPAKDAFSKYDEILSEILKQDKNKLILLALGPTATVLACDLAQAGCQAIDLGHLDIEYEWFLSKAVSKVKIKNKYVNEVQGGEDVSELISDEKYNNEIIKVIA